MALDGPRQRRGGQDDAAQPGMGMGEGRGLGGDHEVELSRAGADKQDVAGLRWPARFAEPGPSGRSEEVRDVEAAQAIARRRSHGTADGGERGRDQADAVETPRRIAAMEPEWRPDQRFGRGGKRCAFAHAGGAG